MMADLFKTTKTLQIAVLTRQDVKGVSDTYRDLNRLVGQHDSMYPGIDAWMRTKVIPGLGEGERVAMVGYDEGKPIASAIAKQGANAKFCHLHIDASYQDLHLGEVLFSMMALEVCEIADQVHFTLPEGIWEKRKAFFNSFNFREAVRHNVDYRPGEHELFCSTSFRYLWSSVLAKLPKLISTFEGDESITRGLLLSIRPEYASKILNGEKTVEIRRNFSPKYKGYRAAIYSTKPTQSILGQARIADVVVDTPSGIWEKFGAAIGCTEKEFRDYVAFSHTVSAITLDDVTPYKRAMRLSELRMLSSHPVNPPQTYCTMASNRGWAEAITIAELLQGRFQAEVELY